MSHDCKYEGFLGEVKEFINNTKGMRVTLGGIVLAIIIQVGAFLFMWGGLTTTVNNHTKNIDSIMCKLNDVKIVGYANAAETK